MLKKILGNTEKIITLLKGISTALNVKANKGSCSMRQLNDAVSVVRLSLAKGTHRREINNVLNAFYVGSIADLDDKQIDDFIKTIEELNNETKK